MGSRGKNKMKETPYHKRKRKQGETFQKLVTKLFKKFLDCVITCYKTKKEQYKIGENKSGIEIKWDGLTKKTGNLYFEYAEKARERKGNYCPSGILKNDNSWLYVIGDKDNNRIYTFDINLLRRIYKKNKKKKKYKWKQINTSLGFVIPENKASKISLFWFERNYPWELHINKKEINQKDIYIQ